MGPFNFSEVPGLELNQAENEHVESRDIREYADAHSSAASARGHWPRKRTNTIARGSIPASLARDASLFGPGTLFDGREKHTF
jgi:hypothetical protein